MDACDWGCLNILAEGVIVCCPNNPPLLVADTGLENCGACPNIFAPVAEVLDAPPPYIPPACCDALTAGAPKREAG